MAVGMCAEIRKRIKTRIISALCLDSDRESPQIVHYLPHATSVSAWAVLYSK